MFTAIPASMIIPINAIMFNDEPVSRKARMQPTPAKGMVNKMVNGWRKDSNWAAITMYTRMMESSRAKESPSNDSARFSSSPVIFAE